MKSANVRWSGLINRPNMGPLDPEQLLRTAFVDLHNDDGCLEASTTERLAEPCCSIDIWSQPLAVRRDKDYGLRQDCLGQRVNSYRDWPTPFDFYRFDVRRNEP